ncbi:MAG: hypothetical protein J7L82_02385 [Staphylothermus sp.]|nr:hypothetical protein [Staphylothermus sp.]
MLLAISLALILLSPIAIIPATAQVSTQYMVLASFDFLSADELAKFSNITLAGQVWNTTLTSYQVTNGVLNITNNDANDAFLAYPVVLDGYAEVKFAGDGAVGVFDPIAYNESKLLGYELVRTSTGITVYMVNGTEKTAVTSLSTSADTVLVTVVDGNIRFDLPDGTGIYQAAGSGIIALGAPAGSNGVFDKVTLYAKYLAGTQEVDLGSKTILAHKHVVVFEYDVSQYTNIRSAKLVINAYPAHSDPWARWVIILFEDNGQYYMPYEYTIINKHRWPTDVIPSQYSDKYTDIVYEGSGPRTYDVTTWIQQHPKGKLYIGIQAVVDDWVVGAKLVLDADTQDTTTEITTTTGILGSASNEVMKYGLIGLGAIILLVIIFVLMMGGKKRRRAIAPLIAAFLILLVLGGIAAAVMAWLHPEYLTALAFGLGAIAIILVFMLLTSGKRIPNPFHV